MSADSLVEAEGDRLFNTFYLFAPDGRQLARYRKLHLFSLMQEEQHFAPGQSSVIVEIDGLKIGLLICYDLRFPELSRQLALAGARLLLVSAQWPRPRTAHWRALLKARALENQLFVAACNRVGRGGGHSFAGASTILDPWGRETLRLPLRETARSKQIYLNESAAFRSHLNCFADRRPEIYEAAVELFR